MTAPAPAPALATVTGQPGLFRIEMPVGHLVWVYALGERPSGYVRDQWRWPWEVRAVGGIVSVRKADARLVVPGTKEASCSECGETVVYAPSAPKKLPKVCMQCGIDRLNGGRA